MSNDLPPILIPLVGEQPFERLVYGFTDTPFGRAVIAFNGVAICALWFCDGNENDTLNALKHDFAANEYERNDSRAEQIAQRIIARQTNDLILEVEGSEFRLNVWQQLLLTTSAKTLTYGELTERCGLVRGAVRAVASTVASNQIGWIIPCHRIVRSRGEIGRFRWGEERKRAMIDWEKSSK